MPEPSVTALLASYSQGNREALDQLMPILYGELRMLAHRARYSWKNDPAAPGTTSLVHEAFLKLVDRNHPGFENRAHFLYSSMKRAAKAG
jgi:RNA polymerase sigma-70 factor, ECF subfamily